MVIDPYLPRQGNEGYRVTHYALDLDYKIASNRLAGRATLTAAAGGPLPRFSLDLAGMRVAKVNVNGRRARFAQRQRKLHVTPEKPLVAGAEFTVEVRYSGNPKPVGGPFGEVGWEELTEGVIVASQPDGAPSWFPCNDHPSDKAGYDLVVTTDSPYRVVANGALTDRRVRAGRTTWYYHQPEPMATYLATVQIGRYEMLQLGRDPVWQLAAVPERLRLSAGHDLARQPRMMALFTDWFGPYPFAGYTVVVTDDELEIPVEAQGLSVFGANHMDGRRGSERLVAHELAHQWFGNSLTVAEWRHIWLNEGFACYAEWLWSAESGGASADGHATTAWRRLAALPQDLVIGDPGAPSMFDDRLYKRGALTLHALRTTLGDTRFFALLRDWTERNRHATVTTEAFVALAEQYAGRSLAEFFTAWLGRPQLPPRSALTRE
ncbi:MAG TPA: M1 family metallopeptidase [Pseudonocardiaceae bacterium]|jgi:aminopeptidase|nr:M1 family metallopeptidase [Pseudonocardiaceae bacterium]